MEYYEEDEGVSLGQIFKVIFRRWKLLLFITGIIFVFGLLGSQLIYNKLKTEYSSTVEYNVVNVNEGKYIDDSKFNYRDLIQASVLSKVKESDEKYKKVDVEGLIKNENISIEKNTKDSNQTSVVTFTVKVRGKYFPNSETAKDFIYDVLNQAVLDTISIIENSNHKMYLKAYNDAKDYEAEINYLNQEITYLVGNYDKLIELYGDVNSNISDKDNEKISTYKVALENEFNKQTNNNIITYKAIEDLRNELTAKNYVKDFKNNEEALKNKKASLEKKIEENNTTIKSLEDKIALYNSGKKSNEYTEADLMISGNANDAFTPLTTEISKLQAENAKNLYDINIIDAQLANQGGDANEIKSFEARLNKIYEALDKYADIYKNVSTSVVKNESNVAYTGKALEASGGLGLIISVLLFLVGGFVVAAIVNLILDRKYLKEGYNDNAKVIDSPKKEVESNQQESKAEEVAKETKEE